MDSKFLGVGLQNALGIAFLTLLLSVILKIIFTKYEVKGVSEVARMAQKGGENMNRIFSVNFWIQSFTSTLMTMFFIWLIKRITSTVEIPIVSKVAQEV